MTLEFLAIHSMTICFCYKIFLSLLHYLYLNSHWCQHGSVLPFRLTRTTFFSTFFNKPNLEVFMCGFCRWFSKKNIKVLCCSINNNKEQRILLATTFKWNGSFPFAFDANQIVVKM